MGDDWHETRNPNDADRDEAARRIVYGGENVADVAARFGVDPGTASKWAREFARARGVEYEAHGDHVSGGKWWRRTCTRCGETKDPVCFLPGFDHCRECQRRRRNGDA